MTVNPRLRELLDKYFGEKMSSEEIIELQQLLEQEASSESLDNFLQQAYLDPRWKVTGDYDKEKMYEELLARISENKTGEAPVVRLQSPGKLKRLYLRIAIAASVIFILSIGTYFLFFNKTSNQEPETRNQLAHDVPAPQSNRAMITLANGKKVFLDSVANGQLAVQNNITLVKTADGRISYEPIANSQQLTAVSYNTLMNPRGSKVIDMMLADGSHVWLNAGSSITYPVAFVGDERKVTMTGEAYFEVKHNASQPFTVVANGVEVHDLGTSFNVNAYDDEDAVRVTLLQGGIKVSDLTTHNSRLIKPGQQALVNKSTIQLVNPDLQQVMAWKNGKFAFDHANIKLVMRELARWYDLEVSYEGAMPQTEFGGKMGRDLSLAQALQVLAKNEVHYRIDGNKITMLP